MAAGMIPAVGSGLITISQGGVSKGSFNVNQAAASSINLDAIPTVGSAVITITQGGVSKGSFSVNATEDSTIALDSGGAGHTALRNAALVFG